MRIRAIATLTAGLALTACGSSPPTHFFTLKPVAAQDRLNTKPPFPIQVDAVHIPAVLDRTEIVRQNASNGLSISDQDRWGAPFGEMARNVLARDLTWRLPPGAIILPDAPAPPTASHLVVTLATFTEDADRRVRLVGSWSLLHGQPARMILNRDLNLETEVAGNDAGSQADAMSKLLGRLADQIATDLTDASR
jgi:uncharacterized protein